MFLIVPLVLTLFYQIQSSLIIFAPPLLAPNAHIEIGVDAASALSSADPEQRPLPL